MAGGGGVLRQIAGYAGAIEVRWSMQRLAYVLLILGVLGALVSGIGYAPLVQSIPGMPFTALALLSTLGCLGIVLVRLQRLEQAVSQTQEHARTLHAQCQDATGRLETVT